MKRTLGVCYYPEHWPEDQWAEDAARMVDTGLAWVRIGEFAWGRIEATPGILTWDWLDRAIEVLGAAGLQIIMGTPCSPLMPRGAPVNLDHADIMISATLATATNAAALLGCWAHAMGQTRI